MKGKLSVIALILLIPVLVLGYRYSLQRSQDKAKDKLTFSNTQTWSEYSRSFADGNTFYPESLFADISLPPPPSNSSREVAMEIEKLKEFIPERTPELKKAFIAEGYPEQLYMGGYTFAQYTDEKLFPATAALLTESFHDTEVIEMREKKLFDRVNPNYLDPTLTTMLPAHNHPSYPSYRSTEHHFLALVLGALAPERAQEFWNRADEIAIKCQIAGLQYPSDTAAGITLAREIFNALMKSEKFQKLLEAARKEWMMKGLTSSSTPAETVPFTDKAFPAESH